ncbi:hypothetical protein BDB00DRAFT_940432 [Zychaea mexicana]|uniref:uncharacterized protein n=1 Tax=Zychaea mexicana TaxID=64656 RepID=UPI0022FEDF41|nr:uncharacterized protein BDB00DRAFT_940432 [Zychaea mexicana]KAI9491277.1 hypothetical protein BDB00DRAFT_940432 [Zychaea mexicana]
MVLFPPIVLSSCSAHITIPWERGLKVPMVLSSVQELGALFFTILKFVDALFGRANSFKKYIEGKREPLFKSLLQQANDGDQECVFKHLHERKQELGLDDADLIVAADPESFIPERFQTIESATHGKLEDRDPFHFGWGRRAEVQLLNV